MTIMTDVLENEAAELPDDRERLDPEEVDCALFRQLLEIHGPTMDTNEVAAVLKRSNHEVLRAVRTVVRQEDPSEKFRWARVLAHRHARVGKKLIFRTVAVADVLNAESGSQDSMRC